MIGTQSGANTEVMVPLVTRKINIDLPYAAIIPLICTENWKHDHE